MEKIIEIRWEQPKEHYEIGLEFIKDFESKDELQIEPEFSGRKNKFHLTRPGAKFPMGKF